MKGSRHLEVAEQIVSKILEHALLEKDFHMRGHIGAVKVNKKI